MDNIALVNINKGICDLLDVPRCPFLRKFAIFGQFLIKLPTWSVLHYVVKLFIIKKEPEHLQDIGMIQMSMDFNLSADLATITAINNLFD